MLQACDAYLEQRGEDSFFVSPFIDYASKDGLFRKYRIALIDGRPFPVHMAVAEEWKVWYLNADMALSVANRAEEATLHAVLRREFRPPAMPRPGRVGQRASAWTIS